MVEIAEIDEVTSSDVIDYFGEVIAPQVLSRQINKVPSEGTLFDYLQQIYMHSKFNYCNLMS